jgi:hypothetical protein
MGLLYGSRRKVQSVNFLGLFVLVLLLVLVLEKIEDEHEDEKDF